MKDDVQKLWGFCHTLCHDGVDYGDYIVQITDLRSFLKMAVRAPRANPSGTRAHASGSANDAWSDSYIRQPRRSLSSTVRRKNWMF